MFFEYVKNGWMKGEVAVVLPAVGHGITLESKNITLKIAIAFLTKQEKKLLSDLAKKDALRAAAKIKQTKEGVEADRKHGG